MSARNPHRCDLSPWDPDYSDDCPGCDWDRAQEERDDAFWRFQDEIGEGGW